jgi:hypothetical protein
MRALTTFIVSVLLLLTQAKILHAKLIIFNKCYDSSKKNFYEMNKINISFLIDTEKKIIYQRIDETDPSKTAVYKFNIIGLDKNVILAENEAEIRKMQEVNLTVYLNEKKVETSIALFETKPPYKKVNVKILNSCE